MAENTEKEVDGKEKEIKSTISLSKKKVSKLAHSRVSLKKYASVSQTSYGSEASLVMKRQSDFERISSKVPRYQNSYRLDPLKPFNVSLVYREIVATVEGVNLGPAYDDAQMLKAANSIAADVKTKVKQLGFDRCKLCVLVVIGENKLQGLQASFRALWDVDRDSWVTYSHHWRNYFISCTCFGLYHE